LTHAGAVAARKRAGEHIFQPVDRIEPKAQSADLRQVGAMRGVYHRARIRATRWLLRPTAVTHWIERNTQKKAVPLSRDGKTRLHAYENAQLEKRSVRAVVLGVVAAGLGVMLFGMAGMAVGAVGVVRGLLVVAGLVMPGGFAVMLGGVLVVFGGLVVMVDGVVAHVSLPVWREK
jgi:hypothetical protein